MGDQSPVNLVAIQERKIPYVIVLLQEVAIPQVEAAVVEVIPARVYYKAITNIKLIIIQFM